MKTIAAFLFVAFYAMPVLPASDYFADASRPDDSGAGTSTATAKKTITAALGLAAASGDTVHVASGSYPETITISKSVTLLGAQANVDARTRNVPAAQESIIQAVGSVTSLLFMANNIVFDGFEIAGDAVTPSVSDLGIEMSPSFSGNRIVNCIFTQNTIALYPASNGATQTVISFNNFLNNNVSPDGNAIYTDFGLKNALISSNSFSNNPNAAVLVTGVLPTNTNSNVVVQNNDITNCGVAVLFVFVTNGTIDNNRMINCDEGVQLRGGNTEIAITNNTITDSTLWPITCRTRSDVGVDNRDLLVQGNIVSQNAALFIPLFLPGDTRALIDVRNIQGETSILKNLVTMSGTLTSVAPRVPAIEVQGSTMGPVVMDSNEVHGNNSDPAGSTTPSAGIRIDADLPAASTVDIKHSIISGFAYAVESLVTNTTNSVHINFNDLSAPASSGVVIAASGASTLDAQYNWFGQVSGPSTAGNQGGTGTAIPTGINFNPWLATGTDLAPLDQTSQLKFLASVGLQTPGTPLHSLAPILISGAIATPNPSLVNTSISFAAAGIDPLNRTVSITWDFGDGATAVGAAVTHVYSAAGTFTATATLSAIDSGPLTTSVVVSVTNPPGGGATPPPVPNPFSVKTKSLVASQPHKARDFIKISGGFDLPAGTTKLDGAFVLSIGSLTQTLTVSGTGQATSAQARLKIRVKRKRGAILGTAATFSVSILGDVGSALTQAGLPPGTAGSVTLPAQFTYLNATYAASLAFRVKATKSGSTGK